MWTEGVAEKLFVGSSNTELILKSKLILGYRGSPNSDENSYSQFLEVSYQISTPKTSQYRSFFLNSMLKPKVGNRDIIKNPKGKGWVSEKDNFLSK